MTNNSEIKMTNNGLSSGRRPESSQPCKVAEGCFNRVSLMEALRCSPDRGLHRGAGDAACDVPHRVHSAPLRPAFRKHELAGLEHLGRFAFQFQ